MWYQSGSGRIELQITMEQARTGSHQGQCDSDVQYLSQIPSIKRQLARIDPEVLRNELREYGAWDAIELSDHEQNIQRLLWLACGDILDSHTSRAGMTGIGAQG